MRRLVITRDDVDASLNISCSEGKAAEFVLKYVEDFDLKPQG